MNDKFERYFQIDCAKRVAARFEAGTAAARELSEWLEKTDLGFDWSPKGERYHPFGVLEETWIQARMALDQAADDAVEPAPDRFQHNAVLLAEHVGLDTDETTLFTLAARSSKDGPVGDLIGQLGSDANLPFEVVFSCLTGVSLRKITHAVARTSVLMQTGLVSLEESRYRGGNTLTVSKRLLDALDTATGGVWDILGQLFDDPGKPEVCWEDFAHLGESADFAARLLRGAIKNKAQGINLLFYGPPGTGKTEFCKVLAAYIGATLHAVGESDDNGDEPSRFERIQQLRLGQRFLARRGDSLVLFDEMEDLMSETPSMPNFSLQAISSSISKVHMNRLLETNLVPTIWTCNDIDLFNPALLRRLTFTIEMRVPAEKVRARIWRRLAQKEGLNLEDATCAQLAAELPEPPALVANALRATALGGGGVSDLKLAVRAVGKAMNRGHERAPNTSVDALSFSPALINADSDLMHLTSSLTKTSASHAISLCLSGPPGTGKSAYARYLAKEMGLPVIQKRASDILSKWVGGSEKNIAAAFAEAREATAFLIFDEADSLLSSRALAERNWEVSQVNEMLTWMESHQLPFACTTNLAIRLDPASLRRFTFKVNLKPLAGCQLIQAFVRFFQMAAPIGLEQIENLTPGDFATVRQRATALGITDRDELREELRKESTAKVGGQRQIGFRTPRAKAKVQCNHVTEGQECVTTGLRP